MMPLFLGITPAELNYVAAYLRVREVPAHTALFSVDQPGEVAYIIRSGTVKVHIEQADGSDVILAILGRGEIVGELGLIDGQGRSANAVTMEHTSLVWMDRITLTECLQNMPQVAHNMVTILSRRLRLADAQIQSLATQDVAGRIARQILALAHEYGEPTDDGGLRIPLRLTQGDFAGLIGATRVRVNQVLGTFKDANYISVDHDCRITIHNRDALVEQCR